ARTARSRARPPPPRTARESPRARPRRPPSRGSARRAPRRDRVCGRSGKCCKSNRARRRDRQNPPRSPRQRSGADWSGSRGPPAAPARPSPAGRGRHGEGKGPQERRKEGIALRPLAVTLLVFLARAAVAGIVAAELLDVGNRRGLFLDQGALGFGGLRR